MYMNRLVDSVPSSSPNNNLANDTYISFIFQVANDVIEIMAIVNFGIAWGLPIIILTSLYSTGKIVYNCRKLYTETERSTGWQPWYSVETFKISFKVTRNIKGVNLTTFSFLCMEAEQATGHYLNQDVLVTDAYMRHPSSISQPNKCPSRPYKGLNSSPPWTKWPPFCRRHIQTCFLK